MKHLVFLILFAFAGVGFWGCDDGTTAVRTSDDDDREDDGDGGGGGGSGGVDGDGGNGGARDDRNRDDRDSDRNRNDRDDDDRDDEDDDDDEVVDRDGDGYRPGADCDDRDDDVHPGARERCDGEDNDCDEEVDEGCDRDDDDEDDEDDEDRPDDDEDDQDDPSRDRPGLHRLTIEVISPYEDLAALDFSWGYCSDVSDPADCHVWHQSDARELWQDSILFGEFDDQGIVVQERGWVRFSSSYFRDGDDVRGDAIVGRPNNWLCELRENGPVLNGTVLIWLDDQLIAGIDIDLPQMDTGGCSGAVNIEELVDALD